METATNKIVSLKHTRLWFFQTESQMVSNSEVGELL